MDNADREARMERNRDGEHQPRSAQSSFSDHPAIHYILTIFVIALLLSIRIGYIAYDCFVSGTPAACAYPEELGMPGVQASSTFDLSKLLVALSITCFSHVLLFLAFGISCLPSYLGAFYIGKYYNIQRNVIGVIFWIVAWALVMSSLLLLVGVPMMFHPVNADWRDGAILISTFAIFGIVCGILYCLLAFRNRAFAPPD